MSAARPPDRSQSPRVGADVTLRRGSPARPLQGRFVTAEVSLPHARLTADVVAQRRFGSTQSLSPQSKPPKKRFATTKVSLSHRHASLKADVIAQRRLGSRDRERIGEADFEVVTEGEQEQRGPPPKMYIPLSSGEGAPVVASSHKAANELNEAFYKAKNLLLPEISQCEFDFEKDLVIYYVAGVEQSPLSLRALVVEAAERWVRGGGEPGTVERAVEECARAFEIASGTPVRFSLTEEPVSDEDRVELRRPETVEKNSVLSKLPMLPPNTALSDSQETAMRACYRESFDRAMNMAKQAGFSTADMNEGAQRIGIVEAMLFEATARIRQGLDVKENELNVLRLPPSTPQTAAERRAVAEQIKAVQKQLEQLHSLQQKVNVDRFALYLGILFTPDQSSSHDFESRKAEADAQAARLKGLLDKELAEQLQQLGIELEKQRPSLAAKMWAQLRDKPVKELYPLPDEEYAAKVGSLVYAHLPEVEARVAGSDFLNRNQQYAAAPAAEAGWVELACGTTRAPKQLSALMEEFAKAMHPTDQSARDAVIQGFRRKVMVARARPVPPAVAGVLTAQELEDYYFPLRTPSSSGPPAPPSTPGSSTIVAGWIPPGH